MVMTSILLAVLVVLVWNTAVALHIPQSGVLSGQKATAGTVGCGPQIARNNCSQVADTKISSILHWAMDADMATGVISSTRITHATPAAAYAHSANRHWETDADLPDDAKGICTDIAYQLIKDNPNINVILGGGRRAFTPDTMTDPETGETGKRQDSIDLIQAWFDDKVARHKDHAYVWKDSQFQSVDSDNTDYLLVEGLFSRSHMSYELLRPQDTAGEPSLAEMTEKAIEILDHQNKGFFLVVEGGRIDQAHHDNFLKLALEDTLAFDEAVAKAAEMTNEKDTLIVVTADHAHPVTMGSWASINNDILGVVDDFGFDFGPTQDWQPYLGLSYANVPGPEGRIDAATADSTANDFQFPVTIKMDFDTHGGQDVAIYARGPKAHLLDGVVENHFIPYAMAYAAGIGDYQKDRGDDDK